MTLVVCGAEDAQEGPRTRAAFRCAVHVEESGCDWQDSLARAKSAFSSTHPAVEDLMDWNLANRMGQRIVSLNTTMIDEACRISASMRRSTISELIVDVEMTIESESDALDMETIADEARDAIDALFVRDAVDLAACSPGNGLVIASAIVDTVERTSLARVEEGSRQSA